MSTNLRLGEEIVLEEVQRDEELQESTEDLSALRSLKDKFASLHKEMLLVKLDTFKGRQLRDKALSFVQKALGVLKV